ncbi:MAG: hypothetical protein QXF56_04555 [Candidatus Micrarchaeia archaeon]
MKCEIHTCTIEFAKRFLSDYFESAELILLEDSLDARIDAQYYVDKEVPRMLYKRMIEEAPNYIAKCKKILLSLDESRITQIRSKLQHVSQNL